MICCNCNEPFDQHDVLPNGDRGCRDGKDTFNFVFQVNPEVVEFVKENVEKSPRELTAMWIDRIREQDRSKQG